MSYERKEKNNHEKSIIKRKEKPNHNLFSFTDVHWKPNYGWSSWEKPETGSLGPNHLKELKTRQKKLGCIYYLSISYAVPLSLPGTGQGSHDLAFTNSCILLSVLNSLLSSLFSFYCEIISNTQNGYYKNLLSPNLAIFNYSPNIFSLSPLIYNTHDRFIFRTTW